MMNFKCWVLEFLFVASFPALVSGQSITSDRGLTGGPETAPAQGATPAVQTANGTTLDLALALTAGKPPQVCVDEIKKRFAEDRQAGDRKMTKLQGILAFRGDAFCADYLVLNSMQYKAASQYVKDQAFAQLQKKVETQIVTEIKTMSEQTGSGSGTGGSTNLTSKGVASKFLSVASEYGALTESTSGQTTTVNGTLAGIPIALTEKGIAEDCSAKLLTATPCFHHRVVDYFSRISYSVSFDTSQNGQTISGTAVGSPSGTVQKVNATGNSHSINAISAKWILMQGPSSSKDIQSAVSKFGPEPARKVLAVLQPLQSTELTKELTDPTFSRWRQSMAAKLADDMVADSSGKKAAADWNKMGTELIEKLGVSANMSGEDAAKSDVINDVIELAIEYGAYLGEEESVAMAVAKPVVLTFEYDENRPADQPTNSVFRGIFQHKIGQEATVTVNGAVSIYDSAPSSSIPGASRLRDAQFAIEADEPFWMNTALTGKVGMTVSQAFYFQDQTSPAILNVNTGSPINGVSFTGLPADATQIFVQKGNIDIAQIKLSIGTGSNLKVPLSMTYSNRTELINKPTWRAQIGISYDLDSIFQGK
jgi:hypothetical protein